MNQKILKQLMPTVKRLDTVKSIVLQAAAIASVLLCALSYQAVQAQSAVLPQGGTVVNGQASINTAGSQMNVVNTPGAVINWSSFGIGAGAGVNFQQQNANSSVMNRVTGGNISTIHGNLTSNGRVILVNPAGLVIGAGAVVDTAGFVGSALSATEANAQLNRLRFDSSGGAGRIQVEGVIRSQNGDIVLIAPDITVGASALIQAPNGAVSLAAGQRVQLHGRGLDGITLELQAPSNSAINLGRIEGEAVGLFASQLRHSGIIDARHASIEGGRIVLRAAEGLTVTGTITADGRTDAAGNAGRGGNVTLEGSRIALQGAQISASGPAGGGKVSVGGGWQGKDASIRNASATTMDRDSRINASASAIGNGGQVVVWSDGDTWFAGTISVQGGASTGNGGRVEVSGKERLGFHGVVNTAAANGQAGSLLLDPRNIYILGTGTATLPVLFAAGGTADFSISASAITALTGSVSLQAANDIFVQTNFNLNPSGGTHLVLEAGRSVFIAGAINSNSSSLTDSVTIVANSNNNPFPGIREPGLGVIDMTGGNLYIGNAPGVVKLLVQNGNGLGGGITVTNVWTGDFSAEAVAGINMPPSGTGTNRISADSIFLATMGGNIGDTSNAIKIADTVPTGNGTVALSITAPSSTSSAYVGTNDFGTHIRLAPSSTNPSSAANVGGTVSVSNLYTGISVGALAGETGTANVTVGDLILSAPGGMSFGRVSFVQRNGNTLSVVVNNDLLVTTPGSINADSILLGGPDATGATDITVWGAATFNTDGGVLLQHGTPAASAVRLFGFNNINMTTGQDIVVKGATLIGNTASAIVNLSADNIYVEDYNNAPGELAGKGVVLSSVVDIQVLAGGSASSLIRAGAAGLTMTANNLYVDSQLANASQTSRIEAHSGGNLNLNITNTTYIHGGSAAGAKASIEAQGGGAVNLDGGALEITSGSGFDSGAAIKSSSNINITTTGAILINGSNSNNAGTGISAGANVNLYVSSLQISANTGTVTNSDYGITATGVVNVEGSSMSFVGLSAPIDNPGSSNSRALIRGDGGINITTTYGVTVQGGDGFRTSAVIRSNSDINLVGNTSLAGGAGTESVAMITTTGAVNMTSLSTDVSTAGLGSHALIYAGSNSVTVAEITGQPVATLGQISPTAAALAAVLVPTPDVGSSVLLPSSLPAGSTGTGTVTYSNLSGYTVSFTATIVVSGGVTQTTLVTIPPNGTTSIPVVVTATASGATVTANLGSVSFGTSTAKILPEVLVANNLSTSTLVSLFADISSTIALPASGIPGTTVTGTITYTNLGAATATFTSTVVIDGVTTTQILTLAPGGSTVTLANVVVGTIGNTVTVNAINSNVLESTLTNNFSSQAISVFSIDIASSITGPSSADAGSTVPVVYTFSNNGSTTTTFTPTLIVGGVPIALGSITLPPGQSVTGTQTVMISGVDSSVVADVGIVMGTDANLVNNISSANIVALLPNISTTIALPSAAIAGNTSSAVVTYVNTGVISTQFTSTVVVNGVPQTNIYTLAPGQSITLSFAVPVGTAASVISANANSIYDANASNNNSSGSISPLFADIAAAINLPSTGIPGSTVNGIITYTNLGGATTNFVATVTIDGVATTQSYSLSPGGTTQVVTSILVGSISNQISVNVGNSSVIESALNNNNAAALLSVFLSDISASITAPPSAAAGTTVPVVYTFSNNGQITTTFTPTVVINGVVTSLAPVTLAPGASASGTQSVMIGGSSVSVAANVGATSAVENNTGNNQSNAGIVALLPNISTTIALPTSAVAGSTASAVVTYVNTGTASAQFTSTVIVNGIPQTNIFTLDAGQSLNLTVAVPVGITASNISANASSIYDANTANNNSSRNLAPLFADIATSIIAPSTATVGSVVPTTVVYQNFGAVTSTFNAAVIVDGVTQTFVLTLAPGAIFTQAVNVSVLPSGATLGAQALGSSIIESNVGNNSSFSRILPIIQNVPITQIIPITQILITTAGSNTSQQLQGVANQVSNVLLGFLNTSSTVQTDNSGDVSRRRPPAAEDIGTDDVPICRPGQ